MSLRLRNWIRFLFLISMINLQISAQNQIFFDHISTESGLSSQKVNQIFQDSEGYMWFATQNGLNKFDGYKITVFKNDPNNSSTVSYNNLSSLCEYNGNLWVGSYGGGISRVCSKNNFKRYLANSENDNSIINDNINCFFIDSSKKLWIGTNWGLSLYRDSSDSFDSFLHGKDVQAIIEDDDKNLILSTNTSIIIYNQVVGIVNEFILDNPTFQISRRPIFYSADKKIWVGTNNGIVIIDQRSGKSSKFNDKNYTLNGINQVPITKIYEDSFETVWIGTFRAGLYYLEKNSNEFKVVKTNQYDPNSLTHNSIDDIYEDKSKNLWVSTPAGGLSKHNLKPVKFRHYYHIPYSKMSISNNIILSFFEDKFDRLWVGTDYDISVFDYKNNTAKTIKLPRVNSYSGLVSVLTFCQATENTFWIGTRTGGLYIYDLRHDKFMDYSYFPKELQNVWIRRIIKDKDDNIWITSDKGLFFYNVLSRKIKKYTPENSGLSDEFTIPIYQDNDGIFWIGTRRAGLNRLDNRFKNFKTFKAVKNDSTSLTSNYVVSINGDDNFIWVGTLNGLNRIDRKTLEIKQFTEKDGLPDDCINSILIDDNGNLWMSTNYGISKYIVKENKFRNYDKFDGLQDYKFKGLSSYKSKKGEMFFGGTKGYNVFKPEEVVDNTFIPPVVITSFKVHSTGKIVEKDLSSIETVELTYNENNIEIEFAALDYTSPEKNLYQHKLEGFDKHWSPPSGQRSVSYTNLDGGDYVFKIRGSNNDNHWNMEGTELKITVIPPIYETIIFRILAAVFIIAIVIIWVQVRTRNIELRKMELEAFNTRLSAEITERKQTEVELIAAKEKAEHADKLKSEFLAQISHEIRSPISVISNFVSLIKDIVGPDKDETLTVAFDAIKHANKRITRTIDLIINMSELQLGTYEPVLDNMNLKEDIIEPLVFQYKNEANQKNIGLEFISLLPNPMVKGDRYSVTQIFANLLDNSIKYTKEGSITITLLNEEENILVKVEDTGIGIAKEYLPHIFDSFTQEERGYTRKYDGNGLGMALVKKYCDLNKASISVESKKDVGTQFFIRFNKM